MAGISGGFEPPAYPHDRLVALRRLAELAPGGLVDCSTGAPTESAPAVVRAALEAASQAVGYPPSMGTVEFREAACAWMRRRLGVSVPADQVLACVGTKEFVTSLPRMLHLRDPSRDTVLYPAVAYPSYEMGAQLAGLRAVPVPVDGDWLPDLDRVADGDGERTLLLWLNEPGNPTGSVASSAYYARAAAWARERRIVLASDECYVELSDVAGSGHPLTTILGEGLDGLLAVHSLSKRSHMPGFRAGFAAGDAALVEYLGLVRKHAGLMVPTPVQAAAVAALEDDGHVEAARRTYTRRRAAAIPVLAEHGLVHDGGPGTFYLWLRSAVGADDGWELAGRLAEVGVLAAPGDLYGAAGADHVRLALVQPTERLVPALEGLGSSVAAS